MNPPTALIVDDDPALLTALPEALHLRKAALTVDTCSSASEALKRIAETDYDAIVSDIKMPGMDGLALLSEIKVLRPSTPVLLITGHGEHDLTMQALRGGAYDFIQKPIDREYFLAALTRAIQVRQMSREIEDQRTALERYAIELERTVELRTRELREASRIKDQFLATLSHELRAPLNSILGWAQLLRSQRLDEQTGERALRTIVRNTRSLAEIIDDLLDVSRIITGNLKLEARPIALVPIIEAAIDSISLAADAKRIDLNTCVDPAAGLVLGDPNRLQQVVWNLLSNAIKFTPAGGTVEVKLEKTPSEARITVADTGEGISTAFLPYVFDRFRQADSTFTRKHGGLGLGLAIVRHLVEIHGGSVAAHSAGEGRGALFTVTLPLAKTGIEGHSSPRTPSDGFDLRALEGLRVLIADDELDARELLATVLEQRGAVVATVGSASDAIDWLANNPPPDVLVSDIGMPGEDGFDLISRVRAIAFERRAEIPAIALTAYARPEDRDRVLAAGYQSHLPKPIEPDVLASAIADLVSPRLSDRTNTMDIQETAQTSFAKTKNN